MNFRRSALVGILLVVAGLAAFAAYRFVVHADPTICGYCGRPLHAHLTVTAEIGGTRRQVCCARCALSEANQQRKPVHLISIHDYTSGRAIPPDHAWFVQGSQAKACDHDAMRVNEMKRAEELAYDRCSPGIFAFAKEEDADAFTSKNGGAVISFAELMSEANVQ